MWRGNCTSAVDAQTALNAVNAITAQKVNGYEAGCLPGTQAFAGACWQSSASETAVSAPAAATSCAVQGGTLPEAAQDRALTEATAFAIRIDVAEELTRLNSHLDEIERLLKKGGEIGKRLDFAEFGGIRFGRHETTLGEPGGARAAACDYWPKVARGTGCGPSAWASSARPMHSPELWPVHGMAPPPPGRVTAGRLGLPGIAWNGEPAFGTVWGTQFSGI